MHNLALLLIETNRLAEAEPLMRRAVEILLRFNAATTCEHPEQRKYVANYGMLLKLTGLSSQAVQNRMYEVAAAVLSSNRRTETEVKTDPSMSANSKGKHNDK